MTSLGDGSALPDPAAQDPARRDPAQPDPAQEGADDFRVLFVCTGNLCRSPMAELLFDHHVGKGWSGPGRWRSESAGTAAGDGQPMHPHAATALAELGIDGGSFRTRRLRTPMLHTADLVLTATRGHRSVVAQMYPRVLGRLLTVNQFGYLLTHARPTGGGGTAAQAGAALLQAAKAARSIAPARTDEDDLEDPVNRPFGRFRDVGQILRADIDAVLRSLTSVAG